MVRLTDSGRTLIDQAVAAGLAVQQEMLQSLSPAEVRRVNGLLRGVLASVEQHGGP